MTPRRLVWIAPLLAWTLSVPRPPPAFSDEPPVTEASLRAEAGKISAAGKALTSGRYPKETHEAAASAFKAIPAQVLALEPGNLERARRVLETAEAAAKAETAFWTEVGGGKPVTPDSSAPLLKPIEAFEKAFAELYPPPAGPPAGSGPAPAGSAAGGRVATAVDAVQDSGATDAHDSEKFWERSGSRGALKEPEPAPDNAVQAPPPAPRPDAPPAPAKTVSAPAKGLVVKKVPAAGPSPAPEGAASVVEARVVNLPPGLGAAAATAGGAAARAVGLPGAPAAEGRQKPAPAPAAELSPAASCQASLTDHPSLAGMCQNSPKLAPLIGGVLDAFKEQFGTVKGLVTNLAFMILGLALSVVSGFGMIAKVVASLVSIGLLVGAVLPLLKSGWDAFKEMQQAPAGSLRHAQAYRKVGMIAGSLLIMALMAAAGYGIGKTKAGKAAMAGAQGAMGSALGKIGIKGGFAAIEARIPAGLKSMLSKVFGESKPAGEGETPRKPVAPKDFAAHAAAMVDDWAQVRGRVHGDLARIAETHLGGKSGPMTHREFNGIFRDIKLYAEANGIRFSNPPETMGIFPKGLYEIGVTGVGIVSPGKRPSLAAWHELAHLFHVIQFRVALQKGLSPGGSKLTGAALREADGFLKHMETGSRYRQFEKQVTGMSSPLHKLFRAHDAARYSDDLKVLLKGVDDGLATGNLKFPNGWRVEKVYALFISQAPAILGESGKALLLRMPVFMFAAQYLADSNVSVYGLTRERLGLEGSAPLGMREAVDSLIAGKWGGETDAPAPAGSQVSL